MRRIDFLESPVDLSHWDFAEQFDAYEVSSLILGIEPRASEADEHRVRVVAGRMALHYQAAIDRAQFEMEQSIPIFGNPPDFEDRYYPLRSVELDDLLLKYGRDLDEFPVLGWIADKWKPRFENQEFSRQAIVDWLTAIGMKSVYQFDRTSPRPDADSDELHQLGAENARLLEKVAELERQLQAATAAPEQEMQDDDGKPLHKRERTTLLNIIGAMLDLLVSSGRWTSEATLIETLDAAYGKRGLKQRTLQGKFAEAKLSLKQD